MEQEFNECFNDLFNHSIVRLKHCLNLKLNAIEKCANIQAKFLEDTKNHEKLQDSNRSFSILDSSICQDDHSMPESYNNNISKICRIDYKLNPPDINDLCFSDHEDEEVEEMIAQQHETPGETK